MNEKITIFNFDNIYKKQDFYKKENYKWIDFSDLSGVTRYCDNNALKIIRKRINNKEPTKINFIDSGNYHYVSFVLMEKIDEPFTLVLFDHHTDMQSSLFEKLMSCGCWVKRALDENKFLKEVIIIGAKQELINAMEKQYKGRVVSYSEQTINHTTTWEKFASQQVHYPVYISVDKDVIDGKEAKTNWDQGLLSLKQLKDVYNIIKRNHKILGIDICGECSIYTDSVHIFNKDNELNNIANKKILNMIENYG